jgi:putative tryptophan/tyrosine transport system substrate-binding protein
MPKAQAVIIKERGGVDRRTALAASLGCALSLARAEERRPKVIGVLSPYAAGDTQGPTLVFRQAMQELGYDSKDFVLVARFADGKNERLPALAAELAGLHVDLMLVSTTNAAKAAQAATGTIPIVFESVADPVRAGFADSVAHPGHNLTGSSNFSADLSAKRFQLLKQMVPGLQRIAFLTNFANPYFEAQGKLYQAAADQMGLRLQFLSASSATEIDGAFEVMTRSRVEAVSVGADTFLWPHRQRIADFALKKALPSTFPFAGFVEAGGLMSYGVDPVTGIRLSAGYVDKILKGARPGDLPIEQPTRVELVINRRTANALRLPIPQELLLQAEKVIG